MGYRNAAAFRGRPRPAPRAARLPAADDRPVLLGRAVGEGRMIAPVPRPDWPGAACTFRVERLLGNYVCEKLWGEAPRRRPPCRSSSSPTRNASGSTASARRPTRSTLALSRLVLIISPAFDEGAKCSVCHVVARFGLIDRCIGKPPCARRCVGPTRARPPRRGGGTRTHTHPQKSSQVSHGPEG
jgi:hypothetical protein